MKSIPCVRVLVVASSIEILRKKIQLKINKT